MCNCTLVGLAASSGPLGRRGQVSPKWPLEQNTHDIGCTSHPIFTEGDSDGWHSNGRCNTWPWQIGNDTKLSSTVILHSKDNLNFNIKILTANGWHEKPEIKLLPIGYREVFSPQSHDPSSRNHACDIMLIQPSYLYPSQNVLHKEEN